MSARPPIPTLAEMEASCRSNAAASDFQVRRIRKRISEIGPSKELEALRTEISKHASDAEHWRGYAQYYAARVDAEGGDVRPKLRWVMDGPALVSLPAAAPARPGLALVRAPAQPEEIDDVPF